jgi:hypothetical protein
MTMLTDFDDLDCPDNIGPDHTHIDPNPVILTKNDCMLFLRLVSTTTVSDGKIRDCSRFLYHGI